MSKEQRRLKKNEKARAKRAKDKFEKAVGAVSLVTTESYPGGEVTKVFGIASVDGSFNDEAKRKLQIQAAKAGGNALIGVNVTFGHTNGHYERSYAYLNSRHGNSSVSQDKVPCLKATAITMGTIVLVEPAVE